VLRWKFAHPEHKRVLKLLQDKEDLKEPLGKDFSLGNSEETILTRRVSQSSMSYWL
jgi:hypothetical protein